MANPVRILTIEDEPAVRSGVAAYLEDSGFEVLEADDGPSGLQIFRRERPDVILCDLRLPGMDGLEILSAVTEESPETPVIVVCAGAKAILDHAEVPVKNYLVLTELGIEKNKDFNLKTEDIQKVKAAIKHLCE